MDRASSKTPVKPGKKSTPVPSPARKYKTKKASLRFSPKKKLKPAAPVSPKKTKFASERPKVLNRVATEAAKPTAASAVASTGIPFSTQSSQESFSADVEFEKPPPDVVLTAEQQREHKLKFQRMRALKAVGKYNADLNQQRAAHRKFYYDLQTNIIHVPRRQVSMIPAAASSPAMQVQNDGSFSSSGSRRSTGPYPAALMGYSAQYSDHVPVFSSRELGFFPLNTAIHQASSYAVHCLRQTAGGSRTVQAQDGAADSADESPVMSEEEPEMPQALDIPSDAYETEDQSLSSFADAMTETSSRTPAGNKSPGRHRTRSSAVRIRKPKMPMSISGASSMELNPASSPLVDVGPIPPDTCYYCFLREKGIVLKAPEPEKPPEELLLDAEQPKKRRRRTHVELDLTAVMKEKFVNCTKCAKQYHPSCAGLSRPTLLGMKKFPWECSECKKCIKCQSSAQEGKMMFCDLCDRGFHSFCVHVPKVPKDRWLCEQCAVCTLCGATRPNEEGKRGRACIWQLDWDDDAAGNVAAVRTLCYPCFKRTKWKKPTSSFKDEDEDSRRGDEE